MPSKKSFSVELLIKAWNGIQSTQFPLSQQHDPAEFLDLFLMKYRMFLRYLLLSNFVCFILKFLFTEMDL